MAEGAVAVAVLGADLLQRRYHAADARGRTSLPGSGSQLERRHAQYHQRPQG